MTEHRKLSEPSAGIVSRRLLLLAVIMLAFAALLDPADRIFHMKVPAFVAVLSVWLYCRGLGSRILTQRMWVVILGTSVLIPLIWTMIGIQNNSVHSGDGQFTLIKSFLFLLILPVLLSEDIDLASLIVRMGVLVALLTLAMLAAYLIFPPLFLVLYAITIDKQIAMIALSRNILGVGIGMFYYKTSSLMIFPFSYYCSRVFQRGISWWSSLAMCLLFGTALLISGTRANVLAVLFVAAAWTLIRIQKSGGWLIALAVGALVIAVVTATVIPKYGDNKIQSNAIKLGHLRSYEREFSEKPSVLLWGEGANTTFYSEGSQDWVSVSEVTYVELVRVFGLPMTILFIAGLMWIALALFAEGTLYIALAYVAYLAITVLDPLLISSTGMLVICAMWKQSVKPSGPRSAFHLPAPC